MGNKKVAVVTGSNKGIGYGIVKGLLEKYDGDVYLTARDVSRGLEAVEKLKQLGLRPLFHQLDIVDQESVDKFKKHLEETHGGLDLLVNNSGIIIYRECKEIPQYIGIRDTLKTNYYGTLRVCQALFPLLRQNGRVINVSSSKGHLSWFQSVDLKNKFLDPSLTIDELNLIMTELVDLAKEDKHSSAGWPADDEFFAYLASKVALTCATFIYQKLFDKEVPFRNISINAVHPGFVDTDLTEHTGVLSIEEGSRAPLFLALEADLKGKFVWYDCTIMDWNAPASALVKPRA